MTDQHGKACFEQRSEAELSLAQSAGHPAVVRAHYLMAGLYLDRIYYQGDDDAGGYCELLRY
jgi:hypothetical protein